MLDPNERDIIRGYLNSGMTPDAIANYIGRLSDLDEADILLIRSAAIDMLNELAVTRPRAGRPVLTLLPGGAS
jgi:hypothetical protein